MWSHGVRYIQVSLYSEPEMFGANTCISIYRFGHNALWDEIIIIAEQEPVSFLEVPEVISH